MPTMTYTEYGTLQIVTCWCGVVHAIPDSLYRQARNNKKPVHCPTGHTWVFNESRADRLARELKEERESRSRERAANDQYQAKLRDQRDHAKNQARAQKAAKTRIKNRIAAGVCPCCNRTFQNLSRHMCTQHPSYSSDD